MKVKNKHEKGTGFTGRVKVDWNGISIYDVPEKNFIELCKLASRVAKLKDSYCCTIGGVVFFSERE